MDIIDGLLVDVTEDDLGPSYSLEVPEEAIELNCNSFCCRYVEEIILHKNVRYISNTVFDKLKNLKNIIVDEDNLYWTSIDGVLFTKDKSILIKYPPEKENEIYIIPTETVNLSDNSFRDCKNLKNVIMHDDLMLIGYNAFRNSSLKEVLMSNSILRIGPYAFLACKKLENVVLSKNLHVVEDGMFSGCSELSSIKIPQNVSFIGNRAFANCKNLETIAIPYNIKWIDKLAFKNSPNIKYTFMY